MRLPTERGPLAQARISAGKTQKTVSVESGIAYAHLRRLETGERSICGLSLEKSSALCKSLGISLDRLLLIAQQQEARNRMP